MFLLYIATDKTQLSTKPLKAIYGGQFTKIPGTTLGIGIWGL
jgi:hypothetical protein